MASHCSLELRPRWFIVGPLTSNFDPKETKVESEEFQIKRTLKDQKCFPKPKLLYKELGRLAPLRTSHHQSLQRAEVHYPVNAKNDKRSRIMLSVRKGYVHIDHKRLGHVHHWYMI